MLRFFDSDTLAQGARALQPYTRYFAELAVPGRGYARRTAECMRSACMAAAYCLWGVLLTGSAQGGGGPENVALLVNVNSDSSKTVANHYIQLRKIPPENVVYIDWRGGLDECQGKYFQEQILGVALKTLEERRLSPQIDYLVYSSDFPWRVHLKTLLPEEKFPKQFKPVGSTTGLTYLAPLVMTKNPALVMPSVNWYVSNANGPNQGQCRELANVTTRAFRFLYMWDKDGNHTKEESQGQRYLLSTMLGVTRGVHGNTVEEVIASLRRSKGVDGRRPRGTIYFMKNGDIRSKTRDACFDAVAAQLNQMGVKAKVMQGIVPKGARDVLGLTAGTDQLALSKSGMTILPGALCDNLTSYGGVIHQELGHTVATEFMRMGASGASGTVFEPFAMQAKFPLPSLHLHYARGCSLAEAFYQSVSGPYQLLVLGDPLCQPFAVFPSVELTDVEAGQEVTGNLTLAPKVGAGVVLVDYYIDGRLVARSVPGSKVTVDTTKLSDGYHELRCVGVKGDAIETQGRAIVPIMVKNHGEPLEFTLASKARISSLSNISCTVRQSGATAISIRQNSRELARVTGSEGTVEIPAVKLGRGPVALQAVSEGSSRVSSKPVWIEIE